MTYFLLRDRFPRIAAAAVVSEAQQGIAWWHRPCRAAWSAPRLRACPVPHSPGSEPSTPPGDAYYPRFGRDRPGQHLPAQKCASFIFEFWASSWKVFLFTDMHAREKERERERERERGREIKRERIGGGVVQSVLNNIPCCTATSRCCDLHHYVSKVGSQVLDSSDMSYRSWIKLCIAVTERSSSSSAWKKVLFTEDSTVSSPVLAFNSKGLWQNPFFLERVITMQTWSKT